RLLAATPSAPRTRCVDRRVANGPVHPCRWISRRLAERRQAGKGFLHRVIRVGAFEPLTSVQRQCVAALLDDPRQSLGVSRSHSTSMTTRLTIDSARTGKVSALKRFDAVYLAPGESPGAKCRRGPTPSGAIG